VPQKGEESGGDVSDLCLEERMAHRAYDKCPQQAKFVKDGNEITEVLKANTKANKSGHA